MRLLKRGEDPIGLTISMRYKGQELRGVVTDVSRDGRLLGVNYASGESWPLQPLRDEDIIAVIYRDEPPPRVVFPPAYASYAKAPIQIAASAHRSTAKHTTKALTYAAARKMLFEYLRAEGWKLDTSLKVPHATSPDNRTRVWFKAQAVYVQRGDRSYGGHFDFKSARTSWLDIRLEAFSPAQFAKDIQT